MRRAHLFALLATLSAVSSATAQSWRLRLNAAAQRVEFRGLTSDSVPLSAVTKGPDGGPVAGGYAVTCSPNGYCYFYRSGPLLTGLPATGGMDLTMWGLGVTGLSVRVSVRTSFDINGARVWPGTAQAFSVLEGYGEYLRDHWTIQAGRMLERGRLASVGTSGLDGARITTRLAHDAVEVGAYAGWGFARGSVLLVNSPAVDPLAEYQPGSRQVVVGLLGGWHTSRLDAQGEYRREIDPVTNYMVSERAALSITARPSAPWRVTVNGDYDMAMAAWGSADVATSYTTPQMTATFGARHYRPFFDLWTVWGVFSPVPYNGVSGSLSINPVKTVQLRGRAEWYRYDAAEVSSPQVTLKDRGWRWQLEGAVSPLAQWTVTATGHGELQPGASSSGVDAHVAWRPREQLGLGVEGGMLERPLELRFQDAGVRYVGGSADYRPDDRWRVGVSLNRYWESRDRPDAQAIDWNQWRVSARVSLTLRSDADRWLPPARPAAGTP